MSQAALQLPIDPAAPGPESVRPAAGVPQLITHLDLPETDGLPVDNSMQPLQAALLTETIEPELCIKHPDCHYFVGANTGIYYQLTNPALDGAIAPDWYYVPGVPPLLDGQYRRSYVLWDEVIAPLIVMEFISDTEGKERDRTAPKGKYWLYEKAIRAGYYIIFDSEKEQIEAYHMVDSNYEIITPDNDGRFSLSKMGLKLGLWKGVYRNHDLVWLRWFREDNTLLPTQQERAEQERLEKQRAQEQAEQERLEKQRAQEQAEQERLEKQRAQAQAEQERLEKQRAQEQAEHERLEKQRAQEQAEQERVEKHRAQEQVEHERVEKQRAQEQAEAATAEAEQLKRRNDRLAEQLRALGVQPDITPAPPKQSDKDNELWVTRERSA